MSKDKRLKTKVFCPSSFDFCLLSRCVALRCKGGMFFLFFSLRFKV